MGKLNINNGGIDTNKVMPDIDERFGPYASIEAANAALGASGRNCITAGLTVGITQGDGSVKEYWYQPDGSSLTLVPKQRLSGSPVAGNFASFDANGDIVDSGKKHSDYATAAQGTKADTAYQKPSGGIPATDLASAVQTSLGKADTAVQQVTVGTTTTGAAGTNASVTKSGTATNPVLNFTIPRGADGKNGADGQNAVNPFKGWYPSAASLPANPKVGDYAYVEGATASDPATIYECTTAGTWSDSGRTADTSNAQTFASGEEVNETHIDNTHLANPQSNSIPKANDIKPFVKNLIEKNETGEIDIDGITFTRQQISTTNGSISNSTTRLLSSLIPFENDIYKITVAEGYVIHSICVYNGDTFIGGQNYVGPSVGVQRTILSTITHFRFVIRKSDSTTILLTDPYGLRIFTKIGDNDDVVMNLKPYLINDKYCDKSGWHDYTGATCYVLPIMGYEKVRIVSGPQQTALYYFLSSNDYEDYVLISNGTIAKNYISETLIVPSGANYICIGGKYTSSADHTPYRVLYSGNSKDESVEANPLEDATDNLKKIKIGDVVYSIPEDYSLFDSYPLFEPDAYYINGYYSVSGVWTAASTASTYLIPVNEGDVFWLKARQDGTNSYYGFIASEGNYASFLKDGEPVEFVTGTNIITITDGVNWTKVTIPSGCHYLYIGRTTSSSTLHDFYIKKEVDFVNNNDLLKGTFNSSFSEIDTKSVRERFCSFMTNLNADGEDYGINELETFLFFTDPHLTSHDRYSAMTELRRNTFISTIQKFYNSLPLDYCICGGDWLNSNQDTVEACESLGYIDAYMRKLFKNYLPALGNHDLNPYSNGIHTAPTGNAWNLSLSQNTLKNLMFRENGETYYSSKANNTMFYIFDNGVSFIRAITNNDYPRFTNNRWDQVDWFANKLLTDDEKHSVIVSHIYSNASSESDWFLYPSSFNGYGGKGVHELSKYIREIAIAYNNREQITKNGITYDFSNCEGHVHLYLCGHTHFDYVDTSNFLPVICTTLTERGAIPTFDCCLMDYESNTLKMLRVGTGYGRFIHLNIQNVPVGNSIELPLTAFSDNVDDLIVGCHNDNNVTAIEAEIVGNKIEVTGLAIGVNGVFATSDTEMQSEYYIINVI